MTDAELPSHLQRLNPAQYRAVTSLEGPLLILAGAGSGKTRVLTRRIAHLLHTGAPPDAILAVTFTNKAAAEMKERVEEMVGEAGAKVWVSTFHSTCCRILRQDVEAMGYTRRFAIYDDDDQLRIIKDLLNESGYDKERVDPRAIRGRIDHYKNRMLDVDDVVEQKREHATGALVQTWRAYNEALKASDALDFNDLIGMTVRMFREHAGILSKWRERFRYVMVDEYQDTNRGQYELLALLTGEHRNLAVVGDDDQSIYGFRGADVSIILSFERDNPDATVVKLEQNYRSTGNILDVANNVVAKNVGRLEKKLWTQQDGGPKVQLIVCKDQMDEAKKVARMILQLRRSGHSFEDIAVIYRTNAMSRPFEQAFARVGIAHRIVGGTKFWQRREIRDVLGYLRLLQNTNDDAAFLRVVNLPRRGVGAKTLEALRTEASDRGAPLLATARSGRTGKSHKGLGEFVKLMDELTEAARDLPPPELVATVVDRSGYKAMLETDTDTKDQVTRDARNRLENLDQLVQAAAEFEPPESAWTAMDQLTAWLDRIKLAADTDDIPDGGMVTLMTVHSSKGLEYPVVFVVQMNEKAFPHAKSEEDGIDEERRLAYVAFTRAMRRLVVTRTRTMREYGQGPRAQGNPAQASRFLFGLPAEAIVGDAPGGEPAADQSRVSVLDEGNRRKLSAFTSVQSVEEKVYVAVESAEDLRPGTLVAIEGIGECKVQSLAGGRLRVTKLSGRSLWVPLDGREIQRVVEQ